MCLKLCKNLIKGLLETGTRCIFHFMGVGYRVKVHKHLDEVDGSSVACMPAT